VRAHTPVPRRIRLARKAAAWLTLLGAVCLTIGAFTGLAIGKASHAGWPSINGTLKMHKSDRHGTIRGTHRSDELLGGHGNDMIFGRRASDVIWGDYKPCCQPTTQVDHLYGGPGKDFIYASHGINFIYTGGGRDHVHAHFGSGGEIHCDSPRVLVYLSHRSRRHYHLYGCRHISYRTERMRRH
jgi:hypothetical protein